MTSDILYLDSAAAARPAPETLDFYLRAFTKFYVNQEAAHESARLAREELKKASALLLRSLNADPSSYSAVWTNCGTDAVNAVLAMPSLRGHDILVSAAEHAAVNAALKRRSSEFTIRTVSIKHDGSLDYDELASLLNKDTALFICHHVQSETGAVQDLVRVRDLMNSLSPNAALMTDTIQSVGKIPFDHAEIKPDFMLVSGRKIAAPGGGAVIFNSHKYEEYFKKLRSSQHLLCRVEPALILTLADSVAKTSSNLNVRFEHISRLNMLLREKIKTLKTRDGRVPALTLDAASASPYILHLTVPGIQGAVLVRMFGERGIMLASGSACEAETKNPSAVLTAMGMTRTCAFSALRISLWDDISDSDICRFIDTFAEILLEY